MFNGKDFTGWAGPVENYNVQDGAIVCRPKKGGTIYTEGEYADFVARVEARAVGVVRGLRLEDPRRRALSELGKMTAELVTRGH